MPSYRNRSGPRAWVRAGYHGLTWLILFSAAVVWRLLMLRTTFIAVTGSVGKTTAKECTLAALATTHPSVATFENSNARKGIARTILRVRPWHRYCVVEIGIDGGGQMERWVRMVRPRIGVWLGIARTHTESLMRPEERAHEKSKLISMLPAGGVAILNMDDPHVAAFEPPTRVRVIRFGTGEGVDLRVSHVSSEWPQRLSFRVTSAAEEALVRTRLVGRHWRASAAAACAVAQACGVGLEAAARGLGAVEPMLGRLSPMTLPNGAVVLRDDYNGSIDTLEVALEVMSEARAQRKVLVLSDVSDDRQRLRRRFREFGRRAAEIFDLAVFLGPNGGHSVRAATQAGMPAEGALSFPRYEDAAGFLRQSLRQGDLVLLRGRATDHVVRVLLTGSRDVRCWTQRCTMRHLCDLCPFLERGDPRGLRYLIWG